MPVWVALTALSVPKLLERHCTNNCTGRCGNNFVKWLEWLPSIDRLRLRIRERIQDTQNMPITRNKRLVF